MSIRIYGNWCVNKAIDFPKITQNNANVASLTLLLNKLEDFPVRQFPYYVGYLEYLLYAAQSSQ